MRAGSWRYSSKFQADRRCRSSIPVYCRESYALWRNNAQFWNQRMAEVTYTLLAQCREEVLRPVFDEIYKAKEVIKVECWLYNERNGEGEEPDPNLVLRANTLGPIVDFASSRRELIYRSNAPANVSSVRAFREGHPIACDLEKLGFDMGGSRWKSYLAVPFSPTQQYGQPFRMSVSLRSHLRLLHRPSLRDVFSIQKCRHRNWEEKFMDLEI